MSWSDDMRCLYCDGKLPLYRKITSGQFCSAVHRKAYWQEQEKLAVERLHQTHDSLRAYQPPEELASPLGKSSASEPLSTGRFYGAGQISPYSSEPFPELDLEPSVQEMARSASNTGKVKFAGFVAESKPYPRLANHLLAGPVEFAPWTANDFASPRYGMEATGGQLDPAQRTAMPLFEAAMSAPALHKAVVKDGSAGLVSNTGATPSVLTRVPFSATPATPEFEPEFLRDLRAAASTESVEAPPTFLNQPSALEAQAAPAAPPARSAHVDAPVYPLAQSLSLSRIGSHAGEFAPKIGAQEPLRAAQSPRKTRYPQTGFVGHAGTPAIPAVTGLLPLSLGNARQNHGESLRANHGPQAADLSPAMDTPHLKIGLPALAPAFGFAPGRRYPISTRPGLATSQRRIETADSLTALDLRLVTVSPRRTLRTEELEPSLSLAPGCRYGVQFRPGQIATAAIRSQEIRPEVAKTKIRIVPLPQGFGAADRALAIPHILPLVFHATPKIAPAAQAVASGVVNEYPANQPMQPVAKWEPVEGELAPGRKPSFLTGWSQTLAEAGDRKYVWSHVADFWQHAPRDLKLLAIAIPVLLGLALRPSLPKVRVKAPVASTAIQGDLERGFRARLMNVRQTVSERAGVALNEDFREGLEDWQSRGEPSTGWSFDSNGFVKPGTLALYRPSLGLADYEMQFLGLIDKKALSWVVRAADFDNYYVVKLVVLKGGPLPTIGITRYAVIKGKPQDRVDTVAAINARTDMLYRVSLNVRDDTYLLTLQGKVVDDWSDSRLKRGGIGFFSPRGEESRVRWVQVTHQYDMLGRLCAYLAPYNIPTTNGSW